VNNVQTANEQSLQYKQNDVCEPFYYVDHGKPNEKESKGSPGYIASHGLIRSHIAEEHEQLFSKSTFIIVFLWPEKVFHKSQH